MKRRALRAGRRIAVATALAAGIGLSVSAAHAVRPVPACDMWVYVVDPDPKGVNLRSGPGIRNKVVAVIPKDKDGSLVHLTGTLNGWMRVAQAESVEGKVVFKGTAWGHGSRFAIATRGPGRLRAKPNMKARIVASTPMEYEAIVAGCAGKWLYVKSARGTGWLAPDNYCGSPTTTCP